MILIIGKFVSGIYVGFYCEPLLQKIYWTMVFPFHMPLPDQVPLINIDKILSLGSATLMILMSPRFQGREWRTFRLCAFIGTGLSGFLPIAHGITVFGWEQNWKQSGMPYYLLEGLVLSFGAIFYSVSVPTIQESGVNV